MTDKSYEDYSKFGFHRQLKYRGNFDFDGLYKFCQQWLESRDYDFYFDLVKDKPPYLKYKMTGRKKLNFYCMVLIYLEFLMWDVKEVEIIKDNQKKHMMNGFIKISFSAGFITDYDGDFEKSPGLKKIESFLNNYIFYHENLLKYFDYMDYHLYDFMTDVKKYMGMQSGQNAW
jgi:hypothetical protein